MSNGFTLFMLIHWRSSVSGHASADPGLSFPSQFIKGEPLADDSVYRDAESLCICHLAVVVAISLLIEITEKMERFYADVGSSDPTLQQRPEIFQPICVNSTVNVLNCVIDHLMRVVACQALIGKQCIRVQGRTCFNVLLDLCLQRLFLAVRNYHGTNFPAPFHDAHDCGFILPARACDAALSFANVHVPRFPPMNVSSASTSPVSFSNEPDVKAKRMR